MFLRTSTMPTMLPTGTIPAGWTASVKTLTTWSPRTAETVPPSSSAAMTVPLGAWVTSWGTVPTTIGACAVPPGRSTRTTALALSTGTSTGPPGPASWRCRTNPGSGVRPRTSPVSASSRTSSFGLRLATATVRVTGSTTTPSGASPTRTCWPGGVDVGTGAERGSAASGRFSVGGRVPSVGTPGGRNPVVVGTGGAGLAGAAAGGVGASLLQPATARPAIRPTATTARAVRLRMGREYVPPGVCSARRRRPAPFGCRSASGWCSRRAGIRPGRRSVRARASGPGRTPGRACGRRPAGRRGSGW